MRRPSLGQTIDKSVVLSLTVGLALKQNDYPKDFWTDFLANKQALVPSALALLGVVAIFSPFEAWSARRLASVDELVRKRCWWALGRIIEKVCLAKGSKVVPSDLALHIWRIGRSWRTPWKRQLRRVGLFRLNEKVATTQIVFTRGKGVVGQSWESNQVVSVDVEALLLQIPDPDTYQQVRLSQGFGKVMGMSWTEIQQVKHRGAVMAFPIRRRDKFVGCISLDSGTRHDLLDTPEIRDTINQLCQQIASSHIPSARP